MYCPYPQLIQLNNRALCPDIAFNGPTVRTNLLRLLNNRLYLLLLQSSDHNLHIHTKLHIKLLHIADKMHRRLNNTVLRCSGHSDAVLSGHGIHGRLEARAVASGEHLLRISLACVAGAAEGFGHGEVDVKRLCLDMAFAGADDFGVGGVEDGEVFVLLGALKAVADDWGSEDG